VTRIERLPHIGSDHFPLFTELSYNPARGEDQEGLEADSDDQSRAQSIAEKKGASEEEVPKPGE